MTTDSDDGSIASNSTLTQESEKHNLLEIYNSGVKRPFHKTTLQSINKAVRKIILPKIKFLPGTKAFGGYDMPDLTSEDCWVHRVFDEINMGNASMQKKAEVWMTYRNRVKEQFGLHRSSITVKIKKRYVSGKSPYQNFTRYHNNYSQSFYSLSQPNK
jgi:hypothetical protein